MADILQTARPGGYYWIRRTGEVRWEVAYWSVTHERWFTVAEHENPMWGKPAEITAAPLTPPNQ